MQARNNVRDITPKSERDGRPLTWSGSLLSAACLALILGSTGCDDGHAEEAGENLDEAAEEVGDEIEDAADSVEDALDDAK